MEGKNVFMRHNLWATMTSLLTRCIQFLQIYSWSHQSISGRVNECPLSRGNPRLLGNVAPFCRLFIATENSKDCRRVRPIIALNFYALLVNSCQSALYRCCICVYPSKLSAHWMREMCCQAVHHVLVLNISAANRLPKRFAKWCYYRFLP